MAIPVTQQMLYDLWLCVADDSDGGKIFKVTNAGTTQWKYPDADAAATGNVNIANPGTDTFDGVVLTAGDTLLLPFQTDEAENWLYVFDTSSTPLVRRSDSNTAAEVQYAAVRVADGGTLYGGKAFQQVSAPPIVLGTTDLNVILLSTLAYSGTANRITVTGSVIDISASYVGQASITTLGTVTTGTWNAGVVAGQYGGTGVANTGKTITLGGNLTTSGAFAATFTLTNTTSVTFPLSGTLATTTDLASYLPLVGATYTTTTGNGLALTTSTLTTGNLVSLTSTSTAADANTQTVLNIATSGANGAGGQTTYAAQFSNTHTGAGTNVAGYFTASGGTNNYAVYIDAGTVLQTFAAQTANTAIAGQSYVNTTTATSGNQQYSPYTSWKGVGYTGSAPITTEYYLYNRPKQENPLVGLLTIKHVLDGATLPGAFHFKIRTDPTNAAYILCSSVAGSGLLVYSDDLSTQIGALDISAGLAFLETGSGGTVQLRVAGSTRLLASATLCTITGNTAITGTTTLATSLTGILRGDSGVVSVQSATPAYSITNVSTDRAYDANATSVDELADTLGTLINDLRTSGLIPA